MEGQFPRLRDLHKRILQGARLHEDVHSSASLLMPCFPGKTSNNIDIIPEIAEPSGNVSATWVPRDVTLLQLSLIQILIIKAENLCTEPHVRRQYSCLVELLLQKGLDSTIIELFTNSDKVLLHISSKCLSYLVLFQLKFKNEVNVHWLQFCQKSLYQHPGCHILMPCFTSLIFICKGILADKRIKKTDYLSGILAPLENVTERFCSTYITLLSTTPSLALDADSGSQLSSLLEFLEVLIVLRIELKPNIFLCSQVLSVILPQALNLISSPVPYFIKKQVILVLKRCLLCKAGEDFLTPSQVVSHQQDAGLAQEMTVLAGALLEVVQEDWLLLVPVSDRTSCFGGPSDASGSGPDLGILGAVSLSVVKALEIWFCDEAFSIRMTGKTIVLDTQAFMTRLLAFLKYRLPWKKTEHSCEWVSLTFIEQDDDMLEMAKCLLQIYLRNPSLQSCSSATNAAEKITWNWPSHQCGSNPHCIFLFLLNNVLFDVSVLLDFLISSETCFLEYLVRYLKLLKEEWPQFCLTCTFFDTSLSAQSPTSDSVSAFPTSMVPGVQEECISLPNFHTSTSVVPSFSASSSKDNSKRSTPSFPPVCEKSSSLSGLQRLAEYDSSEDSEPEIADSSCPVIMHCAGAESTDIDKHMERLELKAKHPALQSTPASAQTRDRTCQATSIQQKTAQCLGDLQEAICRLHRKKLFPYNPSALLKLLTHVCALSKT